MGESCQMPQDTYCMTCRTLIDGQGKKPHMHLYNATVQLVGLVGVCGSRSLERDMCAAGTAVVCGTVTL